MSSSRACQPTGVEHGWKEAILGTACESEICWWSPAQRSHPLVPEIAGVHVDPHPFHIPARVHKPRGLRAASPLAGLLGTW